MKRILIAAIALLALTSCTHSSSVTVTKTDAPYTGTAPMGYELEFSSFRQGNTVVYYPRIQGLDDAPRQDKLNEEILNDAKKVITLFGDDIVCITVDYEILAKSDNKIVISYIGHGFTAPECDVEQTVAYLSEIAL